MIITPSKITNKKSQKGQPYLSIKAGNEYYSVWDEKLFNYFFEGEKIDVQITQKGDFKNITGVLNTGVEPQKINPGLVIINRIEKKIDKILEILEKDDITLYGEIDQN